VVKIVRTATHLAREGDQPVFVVTDDYAALTGCATHLDRL